MSETDFELTRNVHGGVSAPRSTPIIFRLTPVDAGVTFPSRMHHLVNGGKWKS